MNISVTKKISPQHIQTYTIKNSKSEVFLKRIPSIIKNHPKSTALAFVFSIAAVTIWINRRTLANKIQNCYFSLFKKENLPKSEANIAKSGVEKRERAKESAAEKTEHLKETKISSEESCDDEQAQELIKENTAKKEERIDTSITAKDPQVQQKSAEKREKSKEPVIGPLLGDPEEQELIKANLSKMRNSVAISFVTTEPLVQENSDKEGKNTEETSAQKKLESTDSASGKEVKTLEEQLTEQKPRLHHIKISDGDTSSDNKPSSKLTDDGKVVAKTLKEQLAEQKLHLSHINTDVADSNSEYSSKLTDEWKEVTEKSVNQ